MTDDSPAWVSRKLLRAARSATLATAVDGQPFATLVIPATAPDLSVLLLLSVLVTVSVSAPLKFRLPW